MSALITKRKARILALLIIVLLTLILSFSLNMYRPKVLFTGSMLVNDSGEPRGGFEWVGVYNVTLTDNEFILTFYSGLGDPLKRHRYASKIIEFINKSHLIILVESNGRYYLICLNFTEIDTVWGMYNGYYIAYYVNPLIFDGFKSHYYVEIRLKPLLS